jgi:D-sedoheptulose 7-phosphate isomerase
MFQPIKQFINIYKNNLELVWDYLDYEKVEILAKDLLKSWKNKNTVFLCGNGGSATNANHLAIDLLYGINPNGEGIKTYSLCSNESTLTCLANDTGYENIFSKQLKTLGRKNDLIICLSGSGNSKNILKVLNDAKKIGIKTHGLFGFDGGSCKSLVDNCIHFRINDMQVAEDFQMIIGHILTNFLLKCNNDKAKN